MQFSTSLNQKLTQESWIKRFTSQPHQLFFSSAIFFAIFVMILSTIILMFKTDLDFTLIHSFGLNYALFTNAFLGFLITVIPKYNAVLEIESKKYILPWIVFQIGVLLAFFVNISLGKTLVAFVILYFISIFYKIIKSSQVINKEDSIYINSILFLGATLLLIEATTNYNLSMLIFFTYILAMVYIIALRMVPAFYFAYTKDMPWQKPKLLKPVSLVLLFLLGISLQFELKTTLQFSSIVASIFFAYTIYKLDFLKKVPAILSILAVGFFWFELGMLSLIFESFSIVYTFKLSLHIFALGFVTTLLIGFGSRVALGHAVPAKQL